MVAQKVLNTKVELKGWMCREGPSYMSMTRGAGHWRHGRKQAWDGQNDGPGQIAVVCGSAHRDGPNGRDGMSEVRDCCT